MQLTRLLFVFVAKGLIDILKPVSNPHWKCSGRRKRFHAHFVNDQVGMTVIWPYRHISYTHRSRTRLSLL